MSATSVRPASDDPVLTWLRVLATLTALCAVLQTLLGTGILVSLGGVFPIHRTIGFTTLAVSVAAAVFAALWARRSGNTGMMFHAISVAVLALVQIGLGELGATWVHVVVGVVFLVAAVALATLAFRRGGASRADRRTSAGHV